MNNLKSVTIALKIINNYDIASRKVCGESAAISDDLVNKWKINMRNITAVSVAKNDLRYLLS